MSKPKYQNADVQAVLELIKERKLEPVAALFLLNEVSSAIITSLSMRHTGKEAEKAIEVTTHIKEDLTSKTLGRVLNRLQPEAGA